MMENNLERENIILKARVRQLQKALLQEDRRIERLFGLSPNLSNFLGLLVTKEFVSKDLVQYEMNVVADAHVSVWRLRKSLEPHGVKIRTMRGLGWYLDEETKQRVTKAIEAQHPIGAVNGEGQETSGSTSGTEAGARTAEAGTEERTADEGPAGAAGGEADGEEGQPDDGRDEGRPDPEADRPLDDENGDSPGGSSQNPGEAEADDQATEGGGGLGGSPA